MSTVTEPPVYTVTVDTDDTRGEGGTLRPPRRGAPVSADTRPEDLGPEEEYVGRKTRGGLPESAWHNPFKMGKKPDYFSRAEVVEKFHAALRRSRDMWNRLGELSGRILRCHCKPGQACHIDAIVEE